MSEELKWEAYIHPGNNPDDYLEITLKKDKNMPYDANISIYLMSESLPPYDRPLLISGGIGMFKSKGNYWVSLMPDSCDREIQWQVKWWAKFPEDEDVLPEADL